MKKLLGITVITLLVLGIGITAMAAQLDKKAFNAFVTILPYAQVEVPESMDFGEIDFSGGFSGGFFRKTITENLILRTNSDVHLAVSSAGWDQPVFNGWLQWVSYAYPLQSGNILSWHAGSGHGGWGDYGFYFTGDEIVIPFSARLVIPEASWYEARAGSYSDTLTITISAR